MPFCALASQHPRLSRTKRVDSSALINLIGCWLIQLKRVFVIQLQRGILVGLFQDTILDNE